MCVGPWQKEKYHGFLSHAYALCTLTHRNLVSPRESACGTLKLTTPHTGALLIITNLCAVKASAISRFRPCFHTCFAVSPPHLPYDNYPVCVDLHFPSPFRMLCLGGKVRVHRQKVCREIERYTQNCLTFIFRHLSVCCALVEKCAYSAKSCVERDTHTHNSVDTKDRPLVRYV